LTLRLGSVSGQKEESEEKSEVKSEVKSVKKTKDKIKDMMKEDKYITLSQMAELLDISVSGVAKSITRMQNHGEIVRHGADNGGYWEVLK
jgi:ATP-dependent DNA helicase RecG